MNKRSARPRLTPGVAGRIEAARRLIRVQEEGAFTSLIGDRMQSVAAERVATEFVGGVTRWRRWLDYLIAASYHGDSEALEPMVRELLRIGVYDLAVAGTAPHAAVHQAVEAARVAVRPGAGKLVNAVLRSVDRKRARWEDELTGDSVEELAVRWSHPDWMVSRWIARFGVAETRKLLVHNNNRPVFSLRIDRHRDQIERFFDAEGVMATPSAYLEDYVRVNRLQPLIREGWVSRGSSVVQDESAGLVVRLLDPQPGEHIVDGCAAPGGKARYIARLMGQGTLDVVDSSERRLRLLDEVEGDVDIRATVADFREWTDSRHGTLDRVLLDVPCTGLGVLSRRADLRWRRTPEDFDALAPLQESLLEAGSRAVRPGGVLVYATCSIAPEENERQARVFLERHPDFRLESAKTLVPDTMVTQDGFFTSLPHRDGIDGAFGARFRRVGQ